MPTDPTRSLHRKLAQIMYEAERIPKNGIGPREQGSYPFVQVGDAADYIRKALAEKVITMMPTLVQVVGQNDRPTAKGGTMTTVDLLTEWTLTDGESGETMKIMAFGAGADTGDKYSGKASTSSMKYALLTGFLLSTGDDTENTDTSDRQSASRRDGGQLPPMPPDRPELERFAENLVGKVEPGKPPVDLQLRQTPEGPAWGFKLKAGNKGYQALAVGPLADTLALLPDLTGQQVRVWGRIEMVPWEKAGKPMPPFARIAMTRVQTDDATIPPMDPETVPMGVVDDDLSDLDY